MKVVCSFILLGQISHVALPSPSDFRKKPKIPFRQSLVCLQSQYILGQALSACSTFLNWFELVYWPFGQRKVHNNHGLRMISQTFGPIGQIGRIHFGGFSAELLAPILALSVP